MSQPMDLEQAVVTAWQATADELPGVRPILDHYRAEPLDERDGRRHGQPRPRSGPCWP